MFAAAPGCFQTLHKEVLPLPSSPAQGDAASGGRCSPPAALRCAGLLPARLSQTPSLALLTAAPTRAAPELPCCLASLLSCLSSARGGGGQEEGIRPPSGIRSDALSKDLQPGAEERLSVGEEAEK